MENLKGKKVQRIFHDHKPMMYQLAIDFVGEFLKECYGQSTSKRRIRIAMESLTNEDTVNSKIHLPGLVQSNALFLETQALGVFGHAKQAKICLEYVFFVKAKTDEKILAKGVSSLGMCQRVLFFRFSNHFELHTTYRVFHKEKLFGEFTFFGKFQCLSLLIEFGTTPLNFYGCLNTEAPPMNGKIISQLLFEEGHFLVEGKYTKGVLELEAATDISGSIVFSITGSLGVCIKTEQGYSLLAWSSILQQTFKLLKCKRRTNFSAIKALHGIKVKEISPQSHFDMIKIQREDTIMSVNGSKPKNEEELKLCLMRGKPFPLIISYLRKGNHYHAILEPGYDTE